MTVPDALAVIKRADQRWATKHRDDPAPADYLTHLATAIEPHLQVGGAPVDLDQATDLERQRLQLEAAHSRNETLEEELDTANTQLVALVNLATGTAWSNDLDAATQVQAALTRIHTLLTEPILLRDPNLERQLDEARAERDTARSELRDLQAELDGTRLELEKTRLAEEGARRDAKAWRERSDGWQGDANQYGSELATAHNLLGRLVDAINEEWHPAGDHTTQVDRAVDLVTAAVDQLNTRYDAGEHVHSYELTTTGRYLPCTCGKRFPKAARVALATQKGDAA